MYLYSLWCVVWCTFKVSHQAKMICRANSPSIQADSGDKTACAISFSLLLVLLLSLGEALKLNALIDLLLYQHHALWNAADFLFRVLNRQWGRGSTPPHQSLDLGFNGQQENNSLLRRFRSKWRWSWYMIWPFQVFVVQCLRFSANHQQILVWQGYSLSVISSEGWCTKIVCAGCRMSVAGLVDLFHLGCYWIERDPWQSWN